MDKVFRSLSQENRSEVLSTQCTLTPVTVIYTHWLIITGALMCKLHSTGAIVLISKQNCK